MQKKKNVQILEDQLVNDLWSLSTWRKIGNKRVDMTLILYLYYVSIIARV